MEHHNPGEERLDRLLRSWGVAEKKQTRQWVDARRVTVNGLPAQTASQYCPAGAVICVDGVPVRQKETVTLMLNKPAGYVCSAVSPRYPTVLSLLGEEYCGRALFLVGRLDVDTEGLLLLTNDGTLSERIARPEQAIPKTYHVTYKRTLCPDAVQRMAAGITVEDGTAYRPAELILLGGNTALVQVTEGRYHEVKRLIKACGGYVCGLRRIAIGGLALDERLAPGQYRLLTEREINTVFAKESATKAD